MRRPNNYLIDRTRVRISNDFSHACACTININYHVKSMHGYYSVFTNMLDKAVCRNKIIIINTKEVYLPNYLGKCYIPNIVYERL